MSENKVARHTYSSFTAMVSYCLCSVIILFMLRCILYSDITNAIMQQKDSKLEDQTIQKGGNETPVNPTWLGMET